MIPKTTSVKLARFIANSHYLVLFALIIFFGLFLVFLFTGTSQSDVMLVKLGLICTFAACGAVLGALAIILTWRLRCPLLEAKDMLIAYATGSEFTPTNRIVAWLVGRHGFYNAMVYNVLLLSGVYFFWQVIAPAIAGILVWNLDIIIPNA